MKKPIKKEPLKKASEEELKERLSILIKVKARKPTLTKNNLMQLLS